MTDATDNTKTVAADADDIDSTFWDGKKHSYRPAPDWRTRIASCLKIHSAADADIDPVTYEVIRHRMWIINIAHGETITRISGSPVLASLDFNMSILSEDAEVIQHAPYVQFLNAGAPLGIRYIMENHSEQPGINEGDIYCANDPWIGACHQMDVLIACPVFVDGQLFAWVSNAGHQYDLGGIVPGGWPQNAVDVYSDPVVLPPFKLVENGVMREDLEAMYLRQSRFPDLLALDLRAQIAGVVFARDELLRLCEQYSAATVKAAMRRIMDHGQRDFQDKLLRIPDGTWSEVRYLDEPLPGDRTTQRTQLNITKKGDRLIIDNEGTDVQTEGTNGLPYTSWSGVILGILTVTMLYERLFAIGGGARQVDFNPTAGLLTCVDYPAAVSGGIMQTNALVNAVQAIISRMLACDTELKKDILAGNTEYLLPVLVGYNDRDEYFGQGLLDAFGGGSGARSYSDGVNTSGPIFSPLSMMLNIEMVEQWYPILYLYRREDCDGGGAGKWRGGTGVRCAITPYRAKTMQVITISCGQAISTNGGPGASGGYPSPASHYLVCKKTDLLDKFKQRQVPTNISELEAGESFYLRSKSNGTPLVNGDVMEMRVVGGGGYGDPLDRPAERIVRDINAGYVSAAIASSVYGVVLTAAGDLDEAATQQRRNEIIAERGHWRPAVSKEESADIMVKVASGEPERAVHEYIVASDNGEERELACARCGHHLGGYCDNYKRHLLMHEGPVTLIPTTGDPAYYLDDRMLFRRYCCPGCKVLIATEVVREGEPVLASMLLH